MSDQETKSDLHDLKIALQVMSHDGMKLLIPVMSAVIGVGTCAGLMYWSFGELQNFSPDSIAISRIDLPAQAAPAAAVAPVARVAPVVASRPVRKARAKAPKAAVRAQRRVTANAYQDYYFYGQDNPTHGKVIRANEACTEYSWDTKKVSSNNRNGFRLAN
jgi:hypothetical protein